MGVILASMLYSLLYRVGSEDIRTALSGVDILFFLAVQCRAPACPTMMSEGSNKKKEREGVVVI